MKPCPLAAFHQQIAPIVSSPVQQPLPPYPRPPIPSPSVNIFGMKILLNLFWIAHQDEMSLSTSDIRNAAENEEFFGL